MWLEGTEYRAGSEEVVLVWTREEEGRGRGTEETCWGMLVGRDRRMLGSMAGVT